MKTLFLPGYSSRNKDWMLETIQSLPELEFLPHYYHHWESGEDNLQNFDFASEISNVSQLVGDQTVNILAKSIGTVLAAQLLEKQLISVDKVILCGIPLDSFFKYQQSYTVFAAFPPEKLSIIHNITDPVGSSQQVTAALNTIHVPVPVIVKNRNDHHYPYPDLFRSFLA